MMNKARPSAIFCQNDQLPAAVCAVVAIEISPRPDYVRRQYTASGPIPPSLKSARLLSVHQHVHLHVVEPRDLQRDREVLADRVLGGSAGKPA